MGMRKEVRKNGPVLLVVATKLVNLEGLWVEGNSYRGKGAPFFPRFGGHVEFYV